MRDIRVLPMHSPNSRRPVANQYLIETPQGEYFQSYRTVIAFAPKNSSIIRLDREMWNYSRTTGKYRNMFLGEGIEETRRKIKDGTYMLTELN